MIYGHWRGVGGGVATPNLNSKLSPKRSCWIGVKASSSSLAVAILVVPVGIATWHTHNVPPGRMLVKLNTSRIFLGIGPPGWPSDVWRLRLFRVRARSGVKARIQRLFCQHVNFPAFIQLSSRQTLSIADRQQQLGSPSATGKIIQNSHIYMVYDRYLHYEDYCCYKCCLHYLSPG